MLSVCAVPGHLRTHRSYTTDQVSGLRTFCSLITHSVAWKQTPDPIKLLIIGVGAGQVGPVLTGPLFRKKLVGVTIITINTCVLVRAAAAYSASG